MIFFSRSEKKSFANYIVSEWPLITRIRMNHIAMVSAHDAQGRWWELLSPTQVLTGEQQQPQLVEKKRRCHGN